MATAQPKRCLRRWTTVVNGHTILPRRCDRARLALKPATCFRGAYVSAVIDGGVAPLYGPYAFCLISTTCRGRRNPHRAPTGPELPAADADREARTAAEARPRTWSPGPCI